MLKESLEIAIPLRGGKTISIKIGSSSKAPIFYMDGDEVEESEAPHQIVEGKSYDYIIEDNYFLKDSFGIVSSNI